MADFFDYLRPAWLSGAQSLAPAPIGLTVREQLPAVTPEEEQSALGSIFEQGLGGLAYAGKVLDKTFGGRAVRGGLNLLAGGSTDPSELLSFLPLSDTLGLTSEQNTVSGRDLTDRIGLTDPANRGESFNADDLIGLGAEVLLDPGTYLTFGAKTAAGQVAKEAGALPRGLRNQFKGYYARESDLLPFAADRGVLPRDLIPANESILPRAVEDAARAKGVTIEPRFLPNEIRPVEETGTLLDELPGKLEFAPGQATPLASPLGFALPFGKPFLNVGTAPDTLREIDAVANNPVVQALTNNKVTRLAGRALDPVARALNQVFEPAAKDARSAAGQDIGRFVSGLEREKEFADRGRMADLFNDLRPLLGRSPEADDAVVRSLTQFAEGPVTTARYRPAVALQAHNFLPSEIDTVNRVAEGLADTMKVVRQREQALGMNSNELFDSAINYFVRQKEPLPRKPGESALQYSNRVLREYTATHASQIGREEILKDIPGGTTQINEWAANKNLAGRDRAFSDEQVRAFLRDELAGPYFAREARNAAEDAAAGEEAARVALLLNTNPDLGYEGALRLTSAAREEGASRRLLDPTEVLADAAWERRRQEVFEQADRIADWLKTVEPKRVEQGVPFFTKDVAKLLNVRLQRSSRATSAAEGAYEAARRYWKPMSEFEAQGVEAVTVPQFLKDMGLNADESAGIAARKLGMPPNALEKVGIPAELARDVLEMNRMWQDPKALTPLREAWDYYTNLFKGFVTAPFLSFHTRNLATGLFNMLRGGVNPNEVLPFGGSAGTAAYNFLRGHGVGRAPADLRHLEGKALDDAIWKELYQARAIGTGTHSADDLIGSAGERVFTRPQYPEATGRNLAGDAIEKGREAVRSIRENPKQALNPLNVQGAGSERDAVAFLTQMREAGQKVEDWIRTTHYLGLRYKGFSPQAAAAEVLKYQLDYRDLSSVERNVIKRFFPWYSFTRRNLPPLAEDLASRPGKITVPARLTTGGRDRNEFTPGYIAEGATIPIPGAPEGQQRYIASFGLPFEDEGVKAIGSLLKGDLRRAGEQVLGMTVPQVKSPLEFVFDRQLYSGRPLSELKPYEFLSAVLPEDRARQLTQLLAQTPASRGLSTANRLGDERKDLLTQAVNLGLGVKITDVDYAKAKDAATKKALGDLLEGQPGVRRSEDYYIPADRIAGLPPDELLLYRLYLNADQRLREQAKARREAARSGQ